MAPKPLPTLQELLDRCLKINASFEIADAGPHGLGLFATSPILRFQEITPYGGTLADCCSATLSPKTHYARIPNSDWAVDGLPVRQALRRQPDGTYAFQALVSLDVLGFGAIANSAPRATANAKVVWTAFRAQGDDAGDWYCLGVGNQKAGVLTAIRDIAIGEQIRWHYQVILPDGTKISP